MNHHIRCLALVAACGLVACGSGDRSISADSQSAAHTSSASGAPPPAGPLELANHFALASDEMRVTFDRTDDDKSAVLVYENSEQTLVFNDDEVQRVSTEAGLVVSVLVFRTVDSGSMSLSVLVPRVEVPTGTSAPVSTNVIFTAHRFSVIPSQRVGQLDRYDIRALQGTASHASATTTTPRPSADSPH